MSLFNKLKPKSQIEKARKMTAFVEKRVICSNHTTACLSLDGKVKCTKMINDASGSFDMGYGYTKFWKDIQSLFLIEGEYSSFGISLIGMNKSKNLLITDKKDRELGQDIKYLNSIKQVYSYPLSQYVFFLKEDGSVVSIPVRSSKLLSKVIKVSENIQGLDVLREVDEILYELKYQQLIVRKKDGYLAASSSNQDTKFEEMRNWKQIKSIIPVWNHYIGLQFDGSIVSTTCFGKEDSYKEELLQLEKMKDIEQIITLDDNVIVLHKSGNVTCMSKQNELKENFDSWKNIIKIYKRKNGYYYGLCLDGTVKVMKVKDSKYNIPFNVESWTNIIGLSFERDWVVGIRKDGTLIATGNNDYGQCQVTEMRIYENFEDLKKYLPK